MLQNQYYSQMANPYYNQPYQNFQAQQRQEQLDQLYNRPYTYNYTKDKNEAMNWPIAPGNHLVFEDQNGQYFYTKSLGFNPNEKPTFMVFKREDFVESTQNNSESIEQNPLKDELDKLRTEFEEFKESYKQNQKPQHFDKNNYSKKGGNDK